MKNKPIASVLAVVLGIVALVAAVWVLRGEAKVTTVPLSVPSALAAGAVPVVLFWLWYFVPTSIQYRPVPKTWVAAMAIAFCLGAAWLLADPLETYRLYGDDFEYIGTSRTFPRAFAHLFTPHNVHIVPVWRIVTALVIWFAGDLERLQETLAATTFGILASSMLLAGRFVARETNSTALGLAATIAFGTTSLMWPGGVWYSAGQATAASLVILIMLRYLQVWRRSRRLLFLIAAVFASLAAAWCWTVGLVSGFVGAVYLAFDRRGSRARWGAVPLIVVSLIAAGLDLRLGGKGIENQAPISFGGRSANEAFHASVGVSHTIQGIAERLILTGLAIVAELNLAQSAVLLSGFAAIWYWTRRFDPIPTPLEACGIALMVGSSLLLWSFRGYSPFNSLRGFVPWYEVVPYHGLILFLIGWRRAVSRDEFADDCESHSRRVRPLTIRTAVLLVVFQASLIVLHQPRVDQSIGTYLPPLSASEQRLFPIPPLLRLRHYMLAGNRARWQREHLVRLDKAQKLARQRGIGRDVLIKTFGRMIYPDPPFVYDADLLDLPETGRSIDPATLRREFGPLFANRPEPRPEWMDPRDPWPPKDAAIGVKRPDRSKAK